MRIEVFFIYLSFKEKCMKKSLLLLLSFVLVFTACKKKKSDELPASQTVTVYTNKGYDSTIFLSGVSNITVTSWGASSLNVMIERAMGPVQKVSLAATGMPTNAKHEWTAPSGYTPFSSMLNLNTWFVKAGTYPVRINGTTEQGVSKDFNVNIIVDSLTRTECMSKFLQNAGGTMENIDVARDTVLSTFTVFYQSDNETLSMDYFWFNYDDDLTKAYRKNVSVLEKDVNVTFDCETGMLTIPEQEISITSRSGGNVKLFKIKGEGKYDPIAGMMDVSYTTEFDDNGTVKTNNFKIKGHVTQW